MNGRNPTLSPVLPKIRSNELMLLTTRMPSSPEAETSGTAPPRAIATRDAAAMTAARERALALRFRRTMDAETSWLIRAKMVPAVAAVRPVRSSSSAVVRRRQSTPVAAFKQRLPRSRPEELRG